MNNLIELIRAARRKNKLKREILSNERKIRDNRKRVELINNLSEYIKDGMTTAEVQEVLQTMKLDYEDRVDDLVIRGGELHKERRQISRSLRDFKEAEIKAVKLEQEE
ncbi:DUF496 family protein [Vibrio crassostreae]|uniref:DUF496 family protein n=1 Tax=Vibrio crassostreae TaxID=246167 RepID=UPI001B304A2F|nr:DUF496 family protein [Vibrio crassostreae]